MGRYTERPIISADQFIYKGLGYNTQINYNFPRRKWTLAARFSSLILHREVRIAAHGLLASYGKDLAVNSGGVKEEPRLNPKAVLVMREMGIDISDHKPCQVDEYLNEDWDYVITVCDNADKTCPAFPGKVKHRLHMPFEDPSKVTEGTYEFKMNEYRRIRDEINDKFFKLYCDMEERKK